jgi:hypothetical protein
MMTGCIQLMATCNILLTINDLQRERESSRNGRIQKQCGGQTLFGINVQTFYVLLYKKKITLHTYALMLRKGMNVKE